jgi:lipid A ethanolaminephosphotransferase
MSLRLFHVTEFAQSQLLSPAFQRSASHPVAIVLFFSLWLTSISNVALWQALYRLPDSGAGKVWWTGICLAILLECALLMLLSLLNWRWTLKLALTALLLLAAFNAYFMLTQDGFLDAATIRRFVKYPGAQFRALLNWKLFAIVTLTGVVPTILLWRMSVKRTPVMRNLFHNLILFASAGIFLAVLWLFSQHMIMNLVKTQPHLRQMLNPFNVLQTLTQMLGSVPQ